MPGVDGVAQYLLKHLEKPFLSLPSRRQIELQKFLQILRAFIIDERRTRCAEVGVYAIRGVPVRGWDGVCWTYEWNEEVLYGAE